MNPIQEKIAQKWKRNAINWYSKGAEEAEKPAEKRETKKYEPEELSSEVQLIDSIKKIIEESSIDGTRKSIFLGSLKSSKQELENGSVPERLPNIIRNLCSKEEIGQKIKYACENTTNAGKSYAYLWGL